MTERQEASDLLSGPTGFDAEEGTTTREEVDWDDTNSFGDEIDEEDFQMDDDSSNENGDIMGRRPSAAVVDSSSDEESDAESAGNNDIKSPEERVDNRKRKLINTVRRQCDKLYVEAPRIDLNLMHDFTDSDLFTIDGDSILADIFAQYGLDLSHGGQLLHLVYLVELFLKDFQEREGQFHIMFFTKAEALWHSDPLKLLARRTIIQHLKLWTMSHNTTCQLITHIPHPNSQEWKEYIEHYHPAFVMLSDGESLDKKQGQCTLLRLLLMSALSLDVDCAFCSPLQRSLRSVNTFYVEARRVEMVTKMPCIPQEVLAQTYELITQRLTLESADCYSEQELQQISYHLEAAVVEYSSDNLLMSTIRDVITVIACAEVMKNGCNMEGYNEMDKVFLEGASRAFILHAVLLQYLPLESRAQNVPNDENISPFSQGLMDNFLTKINYALAKLVASYDTIHAIGSKLTTTIEAIEDTKSLVDLIDGRLLHVTLYLLQKYTENDIKASYPAQILSKFKYLWQVTCALAAPNLNGDDGSCKNPSEDKEFLTAPIHIFQNTDEELASEPDSDNIDKGLVPVTSQLCTDYAGDLVKELASDREGKLSSASPTVKRHTFEENYHWHTGAPLKDDFDRTRDVSESNVTVSYRFRVNPVDLHKELGLIRLRKLYSALGLLEHEINQAETRGFTSEWKAKHLYQIWRNKQGRANYSQIIFQTLRELGFTGAIVKLQDKWRETEVWRYMQKYGESLEGGSKGLKQQTIIVEKSADGKNKQGNVGHKGQKKKQGMTSKEKILQEKEQKDKEKADADAGSKWSTILQGIRLDVAGKKIKLALKKIDDFLNHCNSDIWRVQAMLAKMECYWLAWKPVYYVRKSNKIEPSLFSDVTDTHPMYYPIMLFVSCQETLHYKEILSKKQVLLVGAFMRGLGFNSLAENIENMDDKKAASHKGSLRPLVSQNPPSPDECSVGMTSTRFQLQFVGQWLKRDERSDRDPRVAHFIPDTWQRKLLDAVDNDQSALIVAPTSSGKTYASYYCMEKVLRRSDEGVVVYVSPTKALMNQVSATIYSRYNKNLPQGKVVCGVFSRDFRRKALNCQILVTVPQCLEILLLSPCRQEWAKKIEYVIFDEVHCLGGEIGAEVWEHLLIAINCPFLALSATVRNPEDIQGWLQASQDFKQQQAQQVASQGSKKKNKQAQDDVRNNAYTVQKVVYEERHSDLEKFVYLPKPQCTGKYAKILPNDQILSDTSEFVPLHPLAVLDLKKMKSQGLPADLTLSPRETLVLFNTMQDVYPDCQHLKTLEPEIYFKKNPMLKKQDARNYERALKKELMRWIDVEHDGETKISEVIGKLKHGLQQKEQACKEEWNKKENKIQGGIFSDVAAKENFAKLIRQLNDQNKLPALVFSQNRQLCEKLADRVAVSLEYCEKNLREEFEKGDLYKNAQKAESKKDKETKRSRDAKTKANEKLTKEEREYEKYHRDDTDDVDLGDAKYYLSDDLLPNCTLQGEGTMTEEELEEELHRLPEGDTSDNLCRLIKRGVAYHHAGLNNKQRVAVEKLFRMKYLKVVAATATLALGIHMPCKTVVFACEDLWLKPLAFRQMSGRSGRRGFDLVGNVIFFCVPPQKIRHLITSGLPHLRGHFPFSVSFVLRLMVLTHNSKDQRDAHEKVLALLKHPFVCHKAKDMEEVVKHFFLFSVDYLIHAGLLAANGTPIGLAGLATHLFYHEPANLTFVSMLQEGAFHKICEPSPGGTFSEAVMEKLVMVLAHMFGRIVMPMSMVDKIRKEGVHSKVVFEAPLPDCFSTILKKHNDDVMNVFRSYVHTVCDYAARRGDSAKQNELPLSKVEIQSDDTVTAPSSGHGDLMADMKASSNKSTTLSPFVMTSGHRDKDLHMFDADISQVSEHGDLMADMKSSSNKSTTLSPFVMTSGHKDKDVHMFDADISQAIRQGVHIEHSKIPALTPAEELKDRRGKPLYINAYAYDFYKHGSKKLVGRENRLQSGEVYDKLNDFRLVIASIRLQSGEVYDKLNDFRLVIASIRLQSGEVYDKLNDFRLVIASIRLQSGEVYDKLNDFRLVIASIRLQSGEVYDKLNEFRLVIASIRLQSGEVYDKLNDFRLVIASIRLQSGEVYDKLNDFRLVIASIRLQSGEVYDKLNDFRLVIASIRLQSGEVYDKMNDFRLVIANQSGEVYDKLNDFRLVIASIR
ncbi:probable ATP-dependent RNA helicase DDX60 [Amphiura filiformis]|uniref:probable ATP-dependent RNA helicase DDX60 n=1 Tax=Amphiura filiformis TaxID=82378 RepID=UPI003B22754F